MTVSARKSSRYPARPSGRHGGHASSAGQAPADQIGQEPVQPADFARAGFPEAGARRNSARFAVAQQATQELLGLVQYAMAQQDIRYYLNGMLLLVETGSLTWSRPTDTAWRWPRFRSRPTCQGRCDSSAQGRARACQAARDDAEDAWDRAVATTGSLQLRQRRVHHETRGRQVSRLHESDTYLAQAHRARSPGTAAVAAAGGHPVQREVPGCSLGSYRKQPAHRVQQHRAGRSGRGAGNPIPGEPLDVGFNVSYLLDVLANIPSLRSSARLGTLNSSMLFTSAAEREFPVRRHAHAHLIPDPLSSFSKSYRAQQIKCTDLPITPPRASRS